MTTNQTIHFELVSPEEKLVSEPYKMVSIPGEEGVLGVMAQHTSLVSTLNPGVIRLFDNDDKLAREIFITGGFADITGDNCRILAEEAINVSDLDQSQLQTEISNLKEDLGLAVEKADQIAIERKIAMTAHKLEALGIKGDEAQAA